MAPVTDAWVVASPLFYTSGVVVRRRLAENSWQPGGRGDILHVVAVIE